jgi:hypothetical protein
MRKRVVQLTVASIIALLAMFLFRPFGAGFDAYEFQPLNNWKSSSDSFLVDLTNAVQRGIEIPTVRQLPGGKFTFSFKVKHQRILGGKLYYKIYYQNETYKHKEFDVANGFNYENPDSWLNFYGSWEETGQGFHATPELSWNEEVVITDSFAIIGNPRNEEKYFGSAEALGVSESDIQGQMAKMRRDSTWVNSLREKAKSSNISLEEQLYRDAVWQLHKDLQQVTENQRWRRNPRMGKYKFFIVVGTESSIKDLPVSVQNVARPELDGRYMNPFFYFLYGPGSKNKNIAVLTTECTLRAEMRITPQSGVYVNPFNFLETPPDRSASCSTCGVSDQLFQSAGFAQYVHYNDPNQKANFVPTAADVAGTLYSREDYEKNKTTFKPEQLIRDRFYTTTRPCATAYFDSTSQAVVLSNPGNADNAFRREQVGVRTRVGTTYGKFRVLVDFPELLSEDHVWNGLTNVVRLLYQDDDPWNVRGGCVGGYVPKGASGPYAGRVLLQNHSEIGMEMSKASIHWPATSYAKDAIPADDRNALNNQILIGCTNWDLACAAPKNYVTGIKTIALDKYKFQLHRWDSWHPALSIRNQESDEKLFDQPCWFEIEWTPQHIIWKIGRNKNNMRVVGYMNSDVTSIPDNQMILIIAQEFQMPGAWQPAPFDIRYLPYPKSPLTGKILALEVE